MHSQTLTFSAGQVAAFANSLQEATLGPKLFPGDTTPIKKTVLSVTLVVSTSWWEVPNIWDVRVGSQTWETNGKQTLAPCSAKE